MRRCEIMLPEADLTTFVFPSVDEASTDFFDGESGKASLSTRSIGVGGVMTVVTGVWVDALGGVFGRVLSTGRVFLFDLVFAPCVWIAGGICASSAALDPRREDKLPFLSLLKSPPNVVVPPRDADPRSGLPFGVESFFRDAGFNASFILVLGEIPRDLLDLPDPLESTDTVDDVLGLKVAALLGARLVPIEVVLTGNESDLELG